MDKVKLLVMNDKEYRGIKMQGVRPATEEEILAQECVQKAIDEALAHEREKRGVVMAKLQKYGKSAK